MFREYVGTIVMRGDLHWDDVLVSGQRYKKRSLMCFTRVGTVGLSFGLWTCSCV